MTDSASENGRKRTVPKFASFKPRPTHATEKATDPAQSSCPPSKVDIKIEGKLEDLSRRNDNHEREKHGDHETRRHRHRHHHRRSPERSRDPKREEAGEEPAWVRDGQDNTMFDRGGRNSDFFVVDKKGDMNNVTYGTLHRYSIPQFFRSGQGRLVGLSPEYRIDRELSDQQILYVKGREARSDDRRGALSSSRPKNRTSRFLRIRPDPEYDFNHEAEKDFVSLAENSTRKRRRLDGINSSDSDEPGPNYRSIEGKATASNTIDENVNLESESSNGEQNSLLNVESSKRMIGITLARQTEMHPTNVNGWLALIKHQDDLLYFGKEVQRVPTSAEKRSTADMKLSLYERALGTVLDRVGREQLLLGMMREGSVIWENKKLANKWRSVLQENPDYIILWIEYLNFQQTNFLDFTHEGCRAIFVDCLKILSAKSTTNSEIESIQVYVFLRLTLFMREAGFGEHATALWQAMLELNFFRPESLSANDLVSMKSSFEGFWESEAPRIGEEGAKGWNNSTQTEVEEKRDTSNNKLNPDDLFGSWSQCEEELSLRSRNPARTVDDVEEDDPYRVILFSDIQDFLVVMSGSEAQYAVVNAFLAFCHLPPLPLDKDGHQSNIQLDQFVRNDLRFRGSNSLTDWFGSGRKSSVKQQIAWHGDEFDEMENEWRNSPLSFPLPANISTIDTLLGDDVRWVAALRIWNEKDTVVDLAWLRLVFKTLLSINQSSDSLAVYYMAFEWRQNPETIKKLAKTLLKAQPSSTQLYNAYAVMENRLGNSSTAEHVWKSAISMLRAEDNDPILLWRTRVWEAMDDKDIHKALTKLLDISNDSESGEKLAASDYHEKGQINATDLLRARTFLTAGQEHALSTRQYQQALYYTECSALLAYLSQNLELDPAFRVFQIALDHLTSNPPSNSINIELLHQARARLIHHHITSTKHYTPSLVRNDLESTIKTYPSNTIFLSLYSWLESRFRIDDRVRSLLRQINIGKTINASVIPSFFAVYTELHRSASSGSTVHSTRAAFEHTLEDTTSKHSAALWTLYILFELTGGNAAKIKDVFYRGMRALPWSKQFFMLAFTHLRGVMSFEELRRVYNVLVEKELRVHVDLEEAFEKHDARKKIEEVRSSEGWALDLPEDASSGEE